jgi:P-type Ca2+ transporter type 2C
LSHSLLPCQVDGVTYNPNEGGIRGYGPQGMNGDRALEGLAEVCAAANEASVECKEGVFKAVGMPTEAALQVRMSEIHNEDPRGGAFLQ